MTPSDKSRKLHPIFSLLPPTLIILTTVLSAILSQAGKAGVWITHIICGKALLSGNLPFLPIYPMWGYSFWAAILRDFAPAAQIGLNLVLFFFIYRKIKHICNPNAKLKFINPTIIAIFLVPWIFLQASYFDSSMASLFAVAGVIYFIFDRRDKSDKNWDIVLSAVFLGLSYNFRSEVWLLVLMLLIVLIVTGIRSSNVTESVRKSSILCLIFIIFTLPWLIYTKSATGRFYLGSSNAGGVAYMGLGYLPNNPWGIEANDYFVAAEAERELGVHPYSAEANDYFLRKYFSAIRQHPFSFIKRVLYGCKLVFMGGFYVPELEYLWGFEDEDRTLYDYAGEILKGKLGYSINTYQMRIYTEWGLSPDDIKFRHIAALSVELALRAGGIALFYILLILTGIVIYRRGIADFISLTAVVCLTYILLPQVFLIAHPKHTTFVLPVLLFIIYIAVMKKPKAS